MSDEQLTPKEIERLRSIIDAYDAKHDNLEDDREEEQSHEEPSYEDDNRNYTNPVHFMTVPPKHKSFLKMFRTAFNGALISVFLTALTWVLFYAGRNFQWEVMHPNTVKLLVVITPLFYIIFVILLNIKEIAVWRSWTFEVTADSAVIRQLERPWLGVDGFEISLDKTDIKIVKVQTKWYIKLFGIDASTITIDSFVQEDEEFHDMAFMKAGKQIKHAIGR